MTSREQSKENLLSQPRAQQLGGAAREVAIATLACLLLVGVNYLSFRHYKRWDVTKERLHTLSPRSLAAARDLKSPVTLHVFLSRGEPLFVELDDLVKQYKSATRLLRMDVHDPEAERSEYELFAKKYGIVVDPAGGPSSVAVVAEQGERTWKITPDDLNDLQADEEGGVALDVKAEQAITGALVQLTTGRAARICVSEGHGEWPIDGPEAGRSLALLRDELKRENIELVKLAIENGAPQSDCAAVFVIGPDRAFEAVEVARLMDYVDAGGRLMLALDPLARRDAVDPSGFEGPLRERGIDLSLQLVTDLESSVSTGNPLEHFAVVGFGDHPITRRLRDRGHVVVVPPRAVTPEGEAVALLTTTRRTIRLASITEEALNRAASRVDQDGAPTTIAAALEVKRPGAPADAKVGRLVVFGTSSFLSPAFLIEPAFSNAELSLSLIGWMTERSSLAEIPARRVSARAVVMTESDLTNLFVRVVVLLPLAVLLLGIAVWWSRRT